MKRIISILLAVVMMVSCVIPVFADMGGPTVFQYDVIVTNPDGIRSDSGDYIPYQAKATVMYEFINQNGEIEFNLKYNDKYVMAKSGDISKVVPKVGIDKASKLPKECGKVVINPNGVEMRTGPGLSFDTVTVIPYGTELKSSYASSATNYGWIFVTYNRYSGWIYVYADKADCADIVEDKNMGYIEVLDSCHYIRETPSSEKNLIEVPAGTKLSFRYKINDNDFFVQYKNIKGWIFVNALIEDSDNSFSLVTYTDNVLYTTKESDLYESPVKALSSLKKVSSVPKGKFVRILKTTYLSTEEEFVNWYYTEYNGTFGWVKENDSSSDNIVIDSSQIIKVKKDAPIYSEPSSSASKTGTISAGKNITVAGYATLDGYMLYNNGGEPGWISGDIDFEYVVFPSDMGTFKISDFLPLNYLNSTAGKLNSADNEADSESPVIIETTTVSSSVSQQSSDNGSQKSINIVVICVLAACFLAMAAVIAILIIRKKKAQNP